MMKKLILTLSALGLSGAPSITFAQSNAASCAYAMVDIFSSNNGSKPDWYHVNLVGLLDNGVTTHADKFRVNIGTQGRGDRIYSGQFKQSFSDRGAGNQDTTTLKLYRSGAASLHLDSWGGSINRLNNLSCYALERNSWVLTGETVGRNKGYFTIHLFDPGSLI